MYYTSTTAAATSNATTITQTAPTASAEELLEHNYNYTTILFTAITTTTESVDLINLQAERLFPLPLPVFGTHMVVRQILEPFTFGTGPI